jgi:hypothetical protein
MRTTLIAAHLVLAAAAGCDADSVDVDAGPSDAGPPDGGARECAAARVSAWSSAMLPRAIESAAVAATATHAYLVGGFDGGGASDQILIAPIRGDGELGAFEVSRVTLPGRREHHAAVVAGGHLCVMGGDDGFVNALADVWCAPIDEDGSLGGFTERTPLPEARSAITGVVANGHVVILGGTRNLRDAIPDVLVALIDPRGVGDFRSVGPLPGAAIWAPAAALGDRIWVVPYTGGSATVRVGEVASDGSIRWRDAGAIDVTAPGQGVAIVGRTLWVLGGLDATTTWVAPLFGDGSIGAFTTSAAFPGPRGGVAAIGIDAYVHAIGGLTGPGMPTPTVLSARACE